MSLVARALFNRLSSSTDVLAIVSTAGRITPSHLPQEPVLPAMTYVEVSQRPISAILSDTGTVVRRMQVSSWAKSYSEAKGLATAGRKALLRWGSSTVVTIIDTFLDNEVDLPFDEQTESYHVATDYLVWSCT